MRVGPLIIEEMTCDDGTFLTANNDTNLFSYCTGYELSKIRDLALVRGTAGLVCFVLCFAAFVFELVYIYHITKKNKSATLQRLFIYLTASNLLYSAVLGLHTEHYFTYDNEIQCVVCKVIGFFDQYSGSVQLLLTLGIVLKIFHKVFSFFCKEALKQDLLRRHSKKIEVIFVIACFVLPLMVIWIPFAKNGPGEYGMSGPWCWIRVLESNCHTNNMAFTEQLYIWYAPFTIISFISLLCVIAILVFLVYICFHHNVNRKNLRVVIMDICVLLPFLVAFCTVCIIELSVVILLRQEVFNKDTNYILWVLYAVTTPIGGVVIPIAFFIYLIRQKSFSKYIPLSGISDAHTMQPSDRISAKSYTSQQDRPQFLSRSTGEMSDDDYVMIAPQSVIK